MSTYVLRKDLPSCSVNKELLVQLEAYLIEKVGATEPQGERSRFSITDSIGTEAFDSVEAFRFTSFPEDTKSIKLTRNKGNLFGELSDLIRISVVFHATHPGQISIDVEGGDAQLLAKTILDGILKTIEQYRTNNHVYQVSSTWMMVLFTIVAVISVATLSFALKRVDWPVSILTVGISFWIVTSLGKLRQYTTFDTRLNKIREQRFNVVVWFGGSVLASLVAALIFMAIFRK